MSKTLCKRFLLKKSSKNYCLRCTPPRSNKKKFFSFLKTSSKTKKRRLTCRSFPCRSPRSRIEKTPDRSASWPASSSTWTDRSRCRSRVLLILSAVCTTSPPCPPPPRRRHRRRCGSETPNSAATSTARFSTSPAWPIFSCFPSARDCCYRGSPFFFKIRTNFSYSWFTPHWYKWFADFQGSKNCII